MPATETRRRSRRLELRTTPGERELIDRAASVTATDLTEFVVSHAVEAAQRVLADRDRFDLDDDALSAWDSDQRPARTRPAWAAPADGALVAIRRVTSRYLAPVPLHGDNDVSAFECRSREQTDWLRRHARQSVATGTTRVFVVTEIDSPTVVAYYGWCMAQLDIGSAPARLRKGAGRYPQPIALLARLGVDIRHEGRGLGAALLQDVFARLLELSDDIGCRGLLVHAESDDARAFYRHLVPEFENSPTDELHLVLLMKDIRRTLRR